MKFKLFVPDFTLDLIEIVKEMVIKLNRTYSSCKRQENEEFKRYIKDLERRRNKKFNALKKKIITVIGPRWIQELSDNQRKILDEIKESIRHDYVEENPWRTKRMLFEYGITPSLSKNKLLAAIVAAQLDPQKMFIQLFDLYFSHPIHHRRSQYPISARLILTAIYYLGYPELMRLLREKFHVDEPPAEPQPKKPSEPKRKYVSPYLEPLKTTCFYTEQKKKSRKVLPLPPLDSIANVPYELPTPDIKKVKSPVKQPKLSGVKISKSKCDLAADILLNLEPKKSEEYTPGKLMKRSKKGRSGKKLTQAISKISVAGHKENNKEHGKKHPVPGPLVCKKKNVMYNVGGVVRSGEKAHYMISDVVKAKTGYEKVHGGIVMIDELPVAINNGMYALAATIIKEECDCMKWWDTIKKFLDETKCNCGHLYDFGDNQNVPKPELTYFHRPSFDGGSWYFDDLAIFETDAKRSFIREKFRDLHKTDSLIGSNRKLRNRMLPEKTVCLGDNPKPSEYLKCTFKTIKHVCVVATLPDLHLLPELIEWMRRRIYGPLTDKQKQRQLEQSYRYWDVLSRLEWQCWSKVKIPELPWPKDMQTTWRDKYYIQKHYHILVKKYKSKIFQRFAKVNNVYWPTMYQHTTPTSSFRRIFFSYLGATERDLHYLCPPYENNHIKAKCLAESKRYKCRVAEDLPHV